MTKKEALIQEYLNKSYAIGDKVMVKHSILCPKSYMSRDDLISCVITHIDGDNVEVAFKEYSQSRTSTIQKTDLQRDTYHVGANPFPHDDWHRQMEVLNYRLDGIMSLVFDEFRGKAHNDRDYSLVGLDGQKHKIQITCFNPWVIDANGGKKYYQRDLVWGLKEKQLLIESIYNYLDCGKIVVRKRPWEWVKKSFATGNYDAAFLDVVDGKQRLNTIHEFMHDEFPDMQGNYFSDLSDSAQNEFCDSKSFSFCELREGATDADTIATFLNVNFTGVPVSQEHIDYVKQIQQAI